MQGRGQGLQRHRCPMLLLIARAGHDAPSVVNRTAAGGGRCKRDAAGMLAGVIPIALRHAICPPTCLQLDKYAATPSLLRLTQHADRRTRLLLRDGRFRSPHFYGGIGPGAVDRAWPLASPCSLFAPRPTGFSVAARPPSAAARERQWLMWNALHSLQLAGDSRATLLMLTVRTHAAGRQWTLSGPGTIVESASCNNPSLPQLNLAAARGRSSTIGLRSGFPPRFVQPSLYQHSPALVTSPVGISHHKLRDTGALPRPSLEQVTQCSCGSLRPVAQQPGELPKQVLETKILQLWRELPLQHASLKSKSLRHSEKASRHSPS
jgi:hypothetical protein